jgi:hypothetical protein
MVSGMDLTMSLDCMDTQIQIGPAVFLTGRALQDTASVLAPVWSCGATKSSHVWHSVRLKLSMWKHVQRVEKQCGFEKLLSGLFGLGLEATCIWCDNQSCMKLSENPVFHDRSKHIEIRYYYIRDMVQRGAVRLQFVTTEDQVAYVFTKLLSRTKFEYFRDKLGVVPLQRE